MPSSCRRPKDLDEFFSSQGTVSANLRIAGIGTNSLGKATGMPTYELVLLLKRIPVAEMKDALKRTALSILQEDGVIRNIENLGFRRLPYRMSAQEGTHEEGHFFVYKFDSGPKQIPTLLKIFKRDTDVIRPTIVLVEERLSLKEPQRPVCDIKSDQLPVPFRPHVQEMVRISKKKARKPFRYGDNRTSDPLDF